MTRNNDRIRGMSSENLLKDARISGLVKQNKEQGKELEVRKWFNNGHNYAFTGNIRHVLEI